MRLLRFLPAPLMLWCIRASTAMAQVFDGPGLVGGANDARGVRGPVEAPLRLVILRLLYKVLNFLALAAIVVIIGAGIYLVVSGGSEDAKNKAKTIILYVVVGLLVIFFARTIVGFLTHGVIL